MRIKICFGTGFLLVLAAVPISWAIGRYQLPSSVAASKSLGSIQNSRDQQNQVPADLDPSVQAKQVREQNAAQIRADVGRLYQLASELKLEVSKTDLDAVLSTSVVKKAQEIEKLAKSVKSRSKQ